MLKYSQARARAWAIAASAMTPTTIARYAGARYNTGGAYSRALAQVCAEEGMRAERAQPSGDTTDYVIRPLCWVFEDRAVPANMGHEALIMPE